MAGAAPSGGRGRDATVLGLASVANGLLAYVFVALGTRSFGAATFAPVSVVWSLWALGIAAAAFPFQHRMIVLHESGVGPERVRRDRRRLGVLGAGGSLVLVLVLLPVRETVFGVPALSYPVVTGLVVLSSSWLAVLRGDLAGLQRRGAAAALLVLEQLVRVVAGAVVVLASFGVLAYAWTLPASFVLLVGWRRPPGGGGGGRTTALGRYLVAVAGGTLLGQLVLTGSPVVLSAIGGGPVAVTALFSTLAVARAPYLVGLGAAIRLMGDFGRVVATSGATALGRVVRATALATVAAVAVVVPAAWLLGPWFLRAVFGPDAALEAGATAVVAAGAVLATGSLVLMLVLIAADRVEPIGLTRLVSLVVFAVPVVIGIGEPVDRVVAGFGGSEAVAFLGLVAAAHRATTPSRDRPRSEEVA